MATDFPPPASAFPGDGDTGRAAVQSDRSRALADEQLVELGRLLSRCEVQSVRSGQPLPLGAHREGDGVNFALFSRHATGVRLDIFDTSEDVQPVRCILLDATRNKTGDIWHVWVEGIQPGQFYGFRVNGPYAPEEGYRFNPNKLLSDPYARAFAPVPRWDFRAALGYDPSSARQDLSFSELDDAGAVPKCVVVHENFDWEDDRPLRIPWTSTVIYELHVRGFTIHPSSGVAHPGTYRGLVDKIGYLKGLGVTAVELMPVQEFNETALVRVNPRTGERLRDFWGYDPISAFAPKASYASVREEGAQLLEFKEMVRAFHRAGLEVILDVVFNHTAEGHELGPTVSFRGIDNAIYYLLDEDKRRYRDYTGCGNTINAGHPVVRDFILDALRSWVIEMHVDGFRFDLASVLGRDEQGKLVADSPLLERIAEDPLLRDVKLIAEAWDAAGAYQVGSFSEERWSEWNGRYRDDVRRFWRGDPGMLGYFASRICGSADLYAASGKGPECSVNYVTCHDGFTLNDLVSYQAKHNEENGGDNRDGADENYSDNYGVEGETTNPEIEQTRLRQIKNFLLTLFISRGVPMLLGGDEFRRTQRGNNNAYCQDNETSWIDWSLVQRNSALTRFTRNVLTLRRAHPVLRREAFYTADEIAWFAPGGGHPDWEDPDQQCLACLIHEADGSDLFLMFNASQESVPFVLAPPRRPASWSVVADTSEPSPLDCRDSGELTIVPNQTSYLVGPRSGVVLVTG
jgi:glycogen operon protein